MKRTLLLVLGLLLVGSTGVDRSINLAPANDADAAFTSELFSQVGTWRVGAEFMDDGRVDFCYCLDSNATIVMGCPPSNCPAAIQPDYASARAACVNEGYCKCHVFSNYIDVE